MKWVLPVKGNCLPHQKKHFTTVCIVSPLKIIIPPSAPGLKPSAPHSLIEIKPSEHPGCWIIFRVTGNGAEEYYLSGFALSLLIATVWGFKGMTEQMHSLQHSKYGGKYGIPNEIPCSHWPVGRKYWSAQTVLNNLVWRRSGLPLLPLSFQLAFAYFSSSDSACMPCLWIKLGFKHYLLIAFH